MGTGGVYEKNMTTFDELGLKALIQKLNPSAKVIESVYSKIEPQEILNTGLFNFEEAVQSAGWIEELKKAEHTPETQEYGITSFVFRSKRPFDPQRFWHYVQHKFPENIIRSKGLFWLASRNKQALIWSQAGGSLKADIGGVWWCSMPFSDRIQYLSFVDNQRSIESTWDKTFGDRKNEIVFIGQEMEEDLIKQELEKCLSTNEELSSQKWRVGYKDQWPL